MAEEFKDGCFFIALAPIRSVEHIIQTIAEALKFPIATHENPQHQLLRYLQRRQLLLVMDNFEHLLKGVNIVSEILEAAPAVKILATSRERLNLHSETVLQVGGMTFPDQAGLKSDLTYDAIALFVQSAGKVHPEFDPSPEGLEKIAMICQIVGGMPLAIELAAAWLHILKVDEILSELEKGIDILTSELRDTPTRHRSIRVVFDHTCSMLDETEREIFMRLSVFRSGFTRDAAQQVVGATFQSLAVLVKKSLLSYDPNSGRLEIHELLRQYAQEQLEKMQDTNISTQKAHAAYYAEFMGQRRAHLRDNRQMSALSEIEADIENVRAAWRFYLDRKNIPQIWKFIYSLWHVYWIRWWNHAGMELFAEAVEMLQEDDKEDVVNLRALAMAFQGYFMAWLGVPEQGYELAVKSVDVLEQHDQPEALAFAYDSLSVNAYFLSRITEETQATNKMLVIATDLDDKWLFAFTLFAAGMVALMEENYPEAKRLAESNLGICEEIGDAIGSTMPLIVLGHEALARSEYAEAESYYQRCLKISEQVSFYYSIQTATKYLSKVALVQGKTSEAEKHLSQSLGITKEIGFVRDIINLCYEFARLRVAQNRPEQAVELLTLVISHPSSNQIRWLEGRISDSAKNLLAKLEAELPPEIFSSAVKRGELMCIDRLVTELLNTK